MRKYPFYSYDGASGYDGVSGCDGVSSCDSAGGYDNVVSYGVGYADDVGDAEASIEGNYWRLIAGYFHLNCRLL